MIPINTQINILLQNLGPALVPVMKFFSYLGSESFYILLFPAIYWCLNPALGLRMGIALLSTTSVNSFMKLAFHMPRPYWVDSQVIAYSSEPTFGFPSGHAQMAVSVWGTFGAYIRKPLPLLLSLFLMLMISLSRIYLGLHFISDILGGWLFGLIILCLIIFLDKPVSKWISRTSNLKVFLTAAGIGVFILVAGLAIHNRLLSWQIPVEWALLAKRGTTLIDPLKLKDLFSSVGVWVGFAAGACWLRSKEKTTGKFNVKGKISQKLWRYALGFAGILLFWAGLGLIFPSNESVFSLSLRLIRYGLVGGWISGMAPYIFFKTGLISPERSFNVELINTID